MTFYSSYEALGIERDGSVLTLTLSNPPMNAVSRQMHAELSRVFFDINRDPETRVVVLTGAGDRAFSAGGDLRRMQTRIEEAAHHEWAQSMWEAKEIVYGMLRLERPLIARINGHAMGLGATLAVLSDYSFMIEDAKIADTHVKVGLSAGDGGALIWPFLIGFQRAKRYLMTGEMLTGRQAAEIGLVGESAASIEELDEKVAAFAAALGEAAPRAVNATKLSINLILRRLLEGVIESHLGQETLTYLSQDHYRAAKALNAKETPVFKGD